MESHLIDVNAIRCDDFDTYFKNRANAIYNLIENATGKKVAGRENVNTDLIDDVIVEEQEIFL